VSVAIAGFLSGLFFSAMVMGGFVIHQGRKNLLALAASMDRD